MKKRLESNREIIKILSDYIEENPDIRFHQMLHNLNITETVHTEAGEYLCKDFYGRESFEVLKKIIKD